jgi:hypothetical protein
MDIYYGKFIGKVGEDPVEFFIDLLKDEEPWPTEEGSLLYWFGLDNTPENRNIVEKAMNKLGYKKVEKNERCFNIKRYVKSADTDNNPA